jgi:hypothetical protein
MIIVSLSLSKIPTSKIGVWGTQIQDQELNSKSHSKSGRPDVRRYSVSSRVMDADGG